jgi:hypothetical protein
VRFDVLRAVAIKVVACWNVTPCRVYSFQRFRGTCCLHLQDISLDSIDRMTQSINIVTGWSAGARFLAETRDYLFHNYVQTDYGEAGVKRPGREVHRSLSFSAAVANVAFTATYRVVC